MTTLFAVRNSLFFVCLLLAAVYDLRERMVPNALIACAAFLWISERLLSILFLGIPAADLTQDLICALLLAAPVFFVSFLFRLLTGKRGIGSGDLKLLIVSGLYLSYDRILSVLFLSCLFGLFLSVLSWKGGKKGRTFPFAPAISLSVFLVMNL